MASPGKKTNHQCGTKEVSESASMLPHVGVGGGTPTPRNPRAASMTTATPRWVGARTRYGARHWGRTWDAMVPRGEAPVQGRASRHAGALADSTARRTKQ